LRPANTSSWQGDTRVVTAGIVTAGIVTAGIVTAGIVTAGIVTAGVVTAVIVAAVIVATAVIRLSAGSLGADLSAWAVRVLRAFGCRRRHAGTVRTDVPLRTVVIAGAFGLGNAAPFIADFAIPAIRVVGAGNNAGGAAISWATRIGRAAQVLIARSIPRNASALAKHLAATDKSVFDITVGIGRAFAGEAATKARFADEALSAFVVGRATQGALSLACIADFTLGAIIVARAGIRLSGQDAGHASVHQRG